jgi:hypothetical protein
VTETGVEQEAAQIPNFPISRGRVLAVRVLRSQSCHYISGIDGGDLIGRSCFQPTDTLAGKEFILGDAFSAADVMIGSMLGWCLMIGAIENEATNVHPYLARVGARPAVARAQKD